MAALGLPTIPQMSTRYCGSGCGAPGPGCTDANAWICNVKYFYTHIGAVGDTNSLLYMPPNVLGACCIDDCNGDGFVTIDEQVTVVNIDLLNYDQSVCIRSGFRDNSPVSVVNILRGSNDALFGCQP